MQLALLTSRALTVGDTSQLKLLLENPIMQNWEILDYPSINKFLGTTLKIPPHKTNLPFLFSTFVLSTDGKLHYPDNLSGYSITQYSHNATEAEKDADKLYLLAARTISDAIIIGSHSLNIHPPPGINNYDFKHERINHGKPSAATIIIICRNLTNIDFVHELFTNSEIPICICCFTNTPDLSTLPRNFNISYLSKINNLTSHRNLILVDEELEQMFEKLKQLGFDVIMNESPFFHHQLLEAKLLDELWLSYSFSYIGGVTSSLGDKQKAFLSHNHPSSEILTLQHIGYNFLYSRQRILYFS